ncbi:MAG: hypothetical protein Q7K45_04045 [Nanoarchaeota archaeon]|nr:hypothetical protein [Nanoarchaeota archaeon]
MWLYVSFSQANDGKTNQIDGNELFDEILRNASADAGKNVVRITKK